MKTNENPGNTPASPVRRHLFGAAAVLVGGLGLGVRLRGEGEGEVSHTAEAIHQEIVFKASRKKVYGAANSNSFWGRGLFRHGVLWTGILVFSPSPTLNWSNKLKARNSFSITPDFPSVRLRTSPKVGG